MAREMKDSGVEWIGEIPAGWKIGKIKHFYTLMIGFTPDTRNPMFYDDSGYMWVNISDMEDGKTIFETKKRISKQYVDKFNPEIVPKGSLLYSFKLSVGQTAFAGVPLYTNEAIASFLLRKTVNLHYLRYSSIFIIENAQVNIYNAKILNQDLVKNATIIFPPLNEQEAIANYLDVQCGKIDALLEKIRASIEEYKKLKQAIITRAVTKGVRGDRPMKESGIGWVGEIPRGWRISRIKYECESLDHLREPISADKRENRFGLYDYYGASGVIDKIDRYNVDDTVLLIGEDGANLRMRNLPLVYCASGKFWVNNHAHILKVQPQNDYLYMAYLLEAGDYSVYITGTAQPKLSQMNLMNFPIAVPSLEEQKEITTFLNKKCSQLDILISNGQQLITNIESYKKSIIFEYVTGKKEIK